MSQMFLGIRKENGQIGYLSEGLSIPEFFDLVRPKESSNISTLVDFFPVIEALHETHNEHVERSIRAEYNAVFNYWRDANSFSDRGILLSKSEGLAKSSNDFLTKMDFRIDDKLTKYCHRRTADLNENYKLVQDFGRDVDAYIDILLCFVHSKASLEVASFKKDYVATKYISSLTNKIEKLYFQVVEYNDDSKDIDSASILNFIALHRNDELSLYLKMLPEPHKKRDLRLELFDSAEKNDNDDEWSREMNKKLVIKYRHPQERELEMTCILRGLLLKAQSLSKLIEFLKTQEVEWDPSNNSVSELTQLIERKGI